MQNTVELILIFKSKELSCTTGICRERLVQTITSVSKWIVYYSDMCKKKYIITYYNIHNNYTRPIGPVCHPQKVKLITIYAQYINNIYCLSYTY